MLAYIGTGSRLYFFSDGIPDEGNAEGFSFGKYRLKAMLQNLEQKPSNMLTNEIGSALRYWRAGTNQRDDQTLKVLEISKTEPVELLFTTRVCNFIQGYLQEARNKTTIQNLE